MLDIEQIKAFSDLDIGCIFCGECWGYFGCPRVFKCQGVKPLRREGLYEASYRLDWFNRKIKKER
jgi:hypothetical protein